MHPILFRKFPGLKRRIGWTPLAGPATEIEPMGLIESLACGPASCFVKRDDRCGTLLLGNKVRKMEFLLGDAKRHHTGGVITSGPANSNHLLATAVYGAHLGLVVTCVILAGKEPEETWTRALLAAGAHVVWCPYKLQSEQGQALFENARHWLADLTGTMPHVIPFAGGGARGSLGYVNAALELVDQIAGQEVPAPDTIYLPLATGGAYAGIFVGAALARLRSQVIGVRVISPESPSQDEVFATIRNTFQLLATADSSIPPVQFQLEDIVINSEFTGVNVAAAKLNANEPQAIAGQNHFPIDARYSERALSALLCDARQGSLQGKTVLFWNTCCTNPC
jgi:D-cysteine desulfhydrase